MKTYYYPLLLLAFISVSAFSQTYISDSITYIYSGSGDPDEVASYLKQFGCIDQVTDQTIVDRTGDYIQIVTPLKKEGNYKIVTITAQAKSELRTTYQEDSTLMGLQLINGYAEGNIYYEELDYFDPIKSIESPYLSVNWIVYDSDGDEVFERLELRLINSKDIIQIFHCHPE